MRPTRLLLALVLSLPAAAFARDAAPEPPNPKDRAAIDGCLSGKDTAAQRRTGIGRAAEPCQTAPDGSGTYGIMACFDREHAIWDGLLNRTYREALAAFDEDGRTYLKGVQQAWLTFRSQACEWPGRVYPGGTIGGPLSNACVMEQTALRALDLVEIRDSLKQR